MAHRPDILPLQDILCIFEDDERYISRDEGHLVSDVSHPPSPQPTSTFLRILLPLARRHLSSFRLPAGLQPSLTCITLSFVHRYFHSRFDLADLLLIHSLCSPNSAASASHLNDAGTAASFFLHCFPIFAFVASFSQYPYLATNLSIEPTSMETPIRNNHWAAS